MTPDSEMRHAALDPTRSFAVAAPAGSGKTGLLTQRMLRLLADCEQPEEVLCMTFTRKAAGEMHRRILEALQRARDPEPPQEDFMRLTWELARAVVERDAALGWQLTAAANRLQIHTIDAYGMRLARRLATAADGAAGLAPSETPQTLYREAVRELCAELEAPGDRGAALATLLRHLDNHLPRLEGLLIQLLGRREQWLGHLLASRNGRVTLQRALQQLIEDNLAELHAGFAALDGDLPGLLGYAQANLGRSDAMGTALPGASHADLEQWHGLLALFLTGKNELRKKVDKRQGMPTAKESVDPANADTWKTVWTALRDQLAARPALLALADDVMALPPATIAAAQWQVLEALIRLLPELAARLDLVFQRRGQCDFTAIALAALRALGEEEAPSDLALHLDYRLRHILVDECQDTSGVQFDLLRRLTAGWQEGDGRTLFLVGDGMQSLYGFRDANVGLFLDSRRHPLGALRLQPLDLSANFRSQARLVDWFNRIFSSAFPVREDPGRGAVPYAPALAACPPLPGAAVRIDALDCAADAAAVAELVAARAAQALEAPGSVAILVRNRPHLRTILPALRQRGLSWQATDIDRLGERMAVIDLLSLTRALLNPGDRLAWLAVLRAPWCGLEHADLLALADVAAGDLRGPLLPRLERWADNPRLGATGQGILARVVPVLTTAWMQRGRKPLRTQVEGTWLALGGPAALLDPADLHPCAQYFALLERAADQARDDWPGFVARVRDGYVAPTTAVAARLHILTLHKAKGLEFDTVILPALERRGRNDEPALLLWRERVTASGHRDLLISPPQPSGEARDPLHAWLAREEKFARRLENARTLYVGCTRARQRLNLIFRLPENGSPAEDSLLARIWPALAPELANPGPETEVIQHPPPDTGAAAAAPSPLTHGVRLPPDWQPPPWPAAQSSPVAPPEPAIPAPEDAPLARRAGVLFHRSVRQLLREGTATWDSARIARQQRVWQGELTAAGYSAEAVEQGIARIRRGLENLLADPRGRWLLAEHEDGGAEQELGYREETGSARVAIVDRTFIAAGVRWIIDYKLAEPAAGEPVSVFVARQRELYAAQLARYAALFRGPGEPPVRTALYFPLLPHLETCTEA